MERHASVWQRPLQRDTRRVWLDEKDCERMNRIEFNALRALLVVLNYAAYANDDLQTRLDTIPSGKQRLAMALGGLRAVCNDLIGTITTAQAKQIQNTMTDMIVQIIPKLAPKSQNVVFEKDIAKIIMDLAMERCKDCVEDGESCRSCELYKVLESTTPCDDYGSGLMCPYAMAEWED